MTASRDADVAVAVEDADEQLTASVPMRVAAARDQPIDDLPALYDYVDLEALQRFLNRASPDADPSVTFQVDDTRVVVRPDAVETARD